MLRIDITGFKTGVRAFELSATTGEMGLDEEIFRDVEVDGTVERSQQDLVVRYRARAAATLDCVRTLVRFTTDVAGERSLLFTADDVADDDDVRPLDPQQTFIDITEDVRDTLLLAIPARPIAPGAEDIEIQTRFGDSEDGDDVDPRWEALKGLE